MAGLLKLTTSDSGSAVNAFMAVAECGLGVLMLTPVAQELSWALSVVLFTGFALRSLYLVTNGALTCGCFGKFSTPPSWTLVLDCLVLAVMFQWTPKINLPSPNRAIERGGTALSLMAIAATLLATGAALSAGRQGGADSLAPRDPQEWVGIRFPFVKEVKISDRIDQGLWTIVLVSPECAACHGAAKRYDALATQLKQAGGRAKVALVGIGSSDLEMASMLRSGTDCVVGTMPNPRPGLYALSVPASFIVRDGLVEFIPKPQTQGAP